MPVGIKSPLHLLMVPVKLVISTKQNMRFIELQPENKVLIIIGP